MVVFTAIILGSLVYLLINEFPTDFLQEQELIGRLNSVDEKIIVEVVQDIIFIDDKHVFVPFVSNDEEYGFSLWKWKNGKWHLSRKSVSESIHIIKINEKDPTTYYFVWNFPDDNINAIKLFLLKDRNYRYSDGYTTYYPRIQMEQLYQRDTTYGLKPLTGHMLEVYKEMKAITYNGEDFFNQLFPVQNHIYFTWNMYDQNGEMIDFNINGFSYNGNVQIASEELFLHVSTNELEYPN